MIDTALIDQVFVACFPCDMRKSINVSSTVGLEKPLALTAMALTVVSTMGGGIAAVYLADVVVGALPSMV
jgi:hypothetical protein